MKYLDKVIKDITETNDKIKSNQNTVIFINSNINVNNDDFDDFNDCIHIGEVD